MVTPANSTAYPYENPHDRFPFENKDSSLRLMAGDLPGKTEDHSVSNQGEAFARKDLSEIFETIKKYAFEFFANIGPFVCLAVGFIASGTFKLFGSLIKLQIDQVNIATQQIQQPQIQPQAEIRTVHHHHEHHVYHHYPQQHDFQQRRRSFSIPTCDRMTFERWNSARSEEIIF
ncbi:hypothetical protein PNK_0320 [Candidatus Protochlamydia naegleriophila]|uniref:Uncharacterized protein n=1 Tax=Candidatus Protochlamydia naegleriophila TaxID=389348 RepID=A0A0U5JDK9_9BACT|nr:hypothetical protein [Candidatus Protochlamydia naegleriophila]CUI15957.1 hypothetical protein PNK_0320 [Candidatus Protochlamydia naegleriophila]